MREEFIFVLGAGASIPHGFPSGRELRRRILSSIAQPDTRAYQEAGFSKELLVEFANAFGASDSQSIDFFLSHKGNEDFAPVGKFAIAREISACERMDLLYGAINPDGGHWHADPDKSATGEGWYNQLRNAMEMNLERFPSNARFKFITFNYDRSLEQYLYSMMKGMNRGLSDEAIRDLLEQMQIIHVHGKLGHLPWQTHKKDEVVLKYGERDPLKLLEASKCIRIIDDSKDSDAEFVKSHFLFQRTSDAKVIFLGFGFHGQNVERLRMDHKQRIGPHGQPLESMIPATSKIFATTCGLSERRLKQIAEMTGRVIPFDDRKCHEFLVDLL